MAQPLKRRKRKIEFLNTKSASSPNIRKLQESSRQEDYYDFLVNSGEYQFSQMIPEIQEDVLDQLKMPNNQTEHMNAEQMQFAKRFGKDLNFFSTPRKGEIDLELMNKYQNTRQYTILRSFHFTENHIVPWLYFFIVVDSIKKTNELILYTIHSIKDKEEHFDIVLDANKRCLGREEMRLILDYFKVVEY